MDVDPDTGRVIMSWSNFTPAAPGGVEIRTAFSDNLKTAASADLVAERGRRGDRVRRPGVDSALRSGQQQRVCRVASLPVPGHVLRLRQLGGLRALDATMARRGRRRSKPPSSSPWTRCSATIA